MGHDESQHMLAVLFHGQPAGANGPDNAAPAIFPFQYRPLDLPH
jgi:hypothetical protein